MSLNKWLPCTIAASHHSFDNTKSWAVSSPTKDINTVKDNEPDSDERRFLQVVVVEFIDMRGRCVLNVCESNHGMTVMESLVFYLI